MGLGNGNPKEGDKGSNWRYEYQVLKGLNAINTSLTGGGVCCAATNALLAQIVTNTQDLEIILGPGDITLELGDIELILNAINGKISNDYGPSAGAVRTASQIGNTTGAADFDSGITTAQTLRVVLPTDQTPIPIVAPVGGIDSNIISVSGTPQTARDWSLDFANLPNLDVTVSSRLNTLGQKLMATSAPVVIASDQSAIPVTGPLTDAQLRATSVPIQIDQTVSGTTNGVAITGLGGGTATGQKTMANSFPVVLASDQSTLPVSLPSGAQVITSVSDATGASSPAAAGATSVGFTTDSTFTGTINGVARNASTFYGFDAAPGKTLPAIAYTVVTGSVIVDRIA